MRVSSAREWQYLTIALREHDYDSHALKNQFFCHLLAVLRDEHAQTEDVFLAYRDALLASEYPEDAELPSTFERTEVSKTLSQFGLEVSHARRISLKTTEILNGIDLDPVYKLIRRRDIRSMPIDPALKRKLNDESFTHYNGVAQQLAVRVALTSQRNSTLIVNLPTGCGKTLVAHATSLFASSDELTLVIVPTIGLAIEQGSRAKGLFKKAGLDHGGIYSWHSGQSKADHDDIRKRIRDRRQKILFCSPEAACRSLLPTLFSAADTKSLGSIIIDEAHIIDQWGDEFRPYFQIIASLARSLRTSSPTGLKCILMSATFSRKSLRLLQELFGVEDRPCIHVNGCFLRPEIQYAVRRVRRDEHMSEIKKAVVALPKPMIIYTLYPHDAVSIETELRAMGLSRLASFTGKTPTDRRDRLIGEWGNGELDIMIATSAFGLGMDKANVRSVVHAAVPENIDRFYQEVGRSGRDGLVSQSLVIYFDEQIAQARKLNSTRLITVELGLKKWREMWKHGEILTDGSRNVHVSTLRGDQQRQTDGNQEWNWRTLLLMQRAGLVRIELKRPQPPENAADTDYESYRALLKQYYDHYYDNVTIIPITDDPLNQDVWDKRTKQRRHYEKSEQSRSFELLLGWLRGSSNTALCDVLLDNYTIEGIEPEYACGGCPKCLADGLSIEPPTVGRSAHASGVDALGSVMSALPEGPVHQYVYFPKGKSSNKRMVRSWEFWIRRLLETEGIAAISATPDVLEILEKVLSTNVFWIGDNIDNPTEEWRFWPRLILHTEINRPRPHLGLKDSVKILLAPEELVDESNPNRKWWESVSNSVSLDNFLRA